jgi:dipeptidyl aminopeptidase/acylaminoacyl peptidase
VIRALALAAALASAPLRPFALEDVVAVRTVREMAVSPDGARAAIVVRRAHLAAGTNASELWLVDLRGTRRERRLAPGHASVSAVRWAPAGRDVGFVSRRGGRAQVWSVATGSGLPRRLTAHGEPVASFEWAADGRRLLFLAPAPDTPDEARRKAQKDDARVEGAHWRRHRVWVAAPGAAAEALTDGDRHVRQAAWAPDGRRIAIVTTPTPEADSSLEARVQVVDVARRAVRDVPGGLLGSDPRWSPDGRSLAFLRPFDGREISRNDAHVWAGGAEATRGVSGGLDRDVEDLRWTREGGALEVRYAMGTAHALARVDVAGARATPVWSPGRPLPLAERTGAGWAFVAGDVPAEVWVAGPTGASPRRRTTLNTALADRALPRLESVRWRSGPLEIEGVLAHPPFGVAGPRPLLVIPHGGPRDHTSAVFDPQTAYFASLGYLVLRPNFRGSTGYGDAFARANVADWGSGPFQDVMSGVDALVERGLADPARLFVYGWSYGGYLTNWAVTHTDRFRAAASGAGVADLRMQYVLSDARRWRFDYFTGSPFAGHLDLYARESPITYVASAKTPTLLIHGEQDVRVPLAQGVMMHRGLRDAGVETELVVYPREEHTLSEPRHVLDRLRRIAAWFARHDLRK